TGGWSNAGKCPISLPTGRCPREPSISRGGEDSTRLNGRRRTIVNLTYVQTRIGDESVSLAPFSSRDIGRSGGLATDAHSAANGGGDHRRGSHDTSLYLRARFHDGPRDRDARPPDVHRVHRSGVAPTWAAAGRRQRNVLPECAAGKPAFRCRQEQHRG